MIILMENIVVWDAMDLIVLSITGVIILGLILAALYIWIVNTLTKPWRKK